MSWPGAAARARDHAHEDLATVADEDLVSARGEREPRVDAGCDVDPAERRAGVARDTDAVQHDRERPG